MKRVLLIIVSFLFCTIVYAKSTYTQAQDLANDYIKKFPNYQKYMVTKNADYGFSTTNSLVNSSSYKTGGLINEQEYKISTGSRNSSYLFNGLSFFTMTESGNQVKIIDPKVANGINSQNKSSALSGVRVTGFVSGEIQLRGNGTRVSPWRFIERYNVRFDDDDTKIKIATSVRKINIYELLEKYDSSNNSYTYKSIKKQKNYKNFKSYLSEYNKGYIYKHSYDSKATIDKEKASLTSFMICCASLSSLFGNTFLSLKTPKNGASSAASFRSLRRLFPFAEISFPSFQETALITI